MQTLCKPEVMKDAKPKRRPADRAEDAPRKKRGALMVHEWLREDILWMEIAPGTALDEVALAAKYDVSRTPIREALLLLASEGFVHFLPNRSTIVAPLTLHNIPALLDTFLLLSRGLVRSVAMTGAAQAHDLRGLVTRYGDGLAAGDVKVAFKAQLALYRHLAEHADNRFLEKYFLEAQDASVRLKQLYFFPTLAESDSRRAVKLLGAVVEAVTNGDPEASDSAVVKSILFEAEVVQRSLGPRFGHKMPIEIPAALKGEAS